MSPLYIENGRTGALSILRRSAKIPSPDSEQVRLSRDWCRLSFASIRPPFKRQEMPVQAQAVEDRGGGDRVEDFPPLRRDQVGGDDRGPGL